MGYRKVDCIELHDMHMELSSSGHERYAGDTAHILRSEERPVYKLRMEELRPLIEAFGFELPAYVRLSGLSHQSERPIHGVLLKSDEMELNVYTHYGIGNDHWSGAVSIECEVVTAHLVNIRATLTEDDGSCYVEEITYSGTFTIWWSKQ